MKKTDYAFGFPPKMPLLVLSALIAGCGGQDSIFGDSGAVTSLAPTVTATSPLATSPPMADTPLNSKITATFSKDMVAASIGAESFAIACPAGSRIAGAVAYVAASRTATFAPAAVLPASTTCSATVSTTVKDTTGLNMEKAFVWTFVTGPAPDITPPRVTVKAPAPAATGVAFNAKVIATFNEDMDPATINGNTVIVQGPGAVAVHGTVSYAAGARTATFTPGNPATLAAGSVFTATVTTGARDLAGNPITGNAVWSFTTGAAPDTTRPAVTLQAPTAGAANVAINTKIIATFSEDMDPATITTANVQVKGPGNTAVTGTVTYAAAARTATFIPANPSTLPPSAQMTVTVTTGATDLAGNALAGDPDLLPGASDAVWRFQTGLTPDTGRPTVTLRMPPAGATGIALNSRITATFSEDMDPFSLDEASFTLTGPGLTPVTGLVSYAVGARTAILIPTAPVVLNSATTYTATVKTSARDLAGNGLAGNAATPLTAASAVWTFSTGAAPDSTPPTVIKVNPLDLATGVCLQKSVNATFSENMDPLTLTTATISLKTGGGAPLAGTVTYDALNRIATLKPAADLLGNTGYTATVTTGARDLAGNALTGNKIWSFTTGTQACAKGVDLGSAAPFGNLGGGAGTTNAGTLTVIRGDLGTTAASTSAITGFHDSANDIYTQTGANQGSVNGKIYTCTVSTTGPTAAAVNPSACSIATQAYADALTAYNRLAPGAMPGGTDPGAGQLGGLTLAPGIYQAAGGAFQITGSDLTLDAQGDADAVWVFQSATSLTVGAPGAPRSIILINGAQAKNIYWYVGSAATINAAGGGTMAGSIMASAAVSFSTVGNVAIVTLNGRAVGLNASVTMTNTVINVPAP